MSVIDLNANKQLISNGLRIDASHVSDIYDILISGSTIVSESKIFNGMQLNSDTINKVKVNDNIICMNNCTSSDNTGLIHGQYASGYGNNSYTMANNFITTESGDYQYSKLIAVQYIMDNQYFYVNNNSDTTIFTLDDNKSYTIAIKANVTEPGKNIAYRQLYGYSYMLEGDPPTRKSVFASSPNDIYSDGSITISANIDENKLILFSSAKELKGIATIQILEIKI